MGKKLKSKKKAVARQEEEKEEKRNKKVIQNLQNYTTREDVISENEKSNIAAEKKGKNFEDEVRKRVEYYDDDCFRVRNRIPLILGCLFLCLILVKFLIYRNKPPEVKEDDKEIPTLPSNLRDISDLYENGQYIEAITTVNTMLLENPKDCGGLFLQALIKMEISKEKKNVEKTLILDANENFFLITEDKNCEITFLRKSLIVQIINHIEFNLDSDELVEKFDAISKKRPTNTHIHNYFSLYYLYSRKIKEAFVHINKVIEIDPTNTLAHYHLALVYYLTESFHNCQRSLLIAANHQNNEVKSKRLPIDEPFFKVLELICTKKSGEDERADKLLENLKEMDIIAEKDSYESIYTKFNGNFDFYRFI